MRFLNWCRVFGQLEAIGASVLLSLGMVALKNRDKVTVQDTCPEEDKAIGPAFAFREFAIGRNNILLRFDAVQTFANEFPTIQVQVFTGNTAVVLLTDHTILDAFLQSEWLLAGITSIPAQPSTWIDC